MNQEFLRNQPHAVLLDDFATHHFTLSQTRENGVCIVYFVYAADAEIWQSLHP
jgi:hypothetical protein